MTRSLWSATAPLHARPPLAADVETGVCVVGGGIAGLSVAWHLAGAGHAVVVLDEGREQSETARTTAHLVTALDRGWSQLLWVHGESLARLAAASHAAAIDRIEAIVREEHVACDFARVDGWLFGAPGQPPSRLDEELEAARRVGLVGVEIVSRAPLPGFDTGRAVRYPGQGQLHATRYLAGLRDAVERRGGQVFGGTRVTALGDGESPVPVHTADGRTVRAGTVVLATNTPVAGAPGLHTKQAAYRTYVVASRMPGGAVPPGLWWDTADPFHYVRVQPERDADVLIVGGEDHKTGQEGGGSRARWDALEAWTRERFPSAGSVEYRWSGQVMESMDGLGFIGRLGSRPDVFVVTGDSGNGMTNGTIAGMLLADLILGRENPWTDVYDPGRMRLRAVGEFARENLNVATQYASWVVPGERGGLPAPGTGQVVRRGLAKVAVHRAEDGTLTERSAVCTHLGCVVAWNAAEASWDCPCHGSRFDARGRVLHGPATQDLAPVGQPAEPEVPAVATSTSPAS